MRVPAPDAAARRATDGPLLAAESLCRSYGGRPVVDGVSIAVQAGEVLGILGPNGAGKSTLFRLLLLLEAPDGGRVLLNGRPVRPGDREARRRLAGVFQHPHLFAGTVGENLRFGLRAAGVPRVEWSRRVERARDRMGLGGLVRAPVGTLSGGESQRVALARALVLEPWVLLLDEPTASLDVTVRRSFREQLAGTIREGAQGVVLITHDPAEAFDLADRVAVMERGRIVQVGTPEELTAEPATPFVAAFAGAELLLDGVVVRAGGGTAEVRVAGGSLHARCPDPAVANGDRVHVRYRPEDVLLAPCDTAETSARNRLSVVVGSVRPAAGLVRVRLRGPVSLNALVTRESADRLGLEPGRAVLALLKTAALSIYRAGSPP